jgi:carbon-monoxide dehydrogenase small subunit
MKSPSLARAKKIDLRCKVNGKSHKLRAYPMARLLDVLREEARLTGTKEGCGEGECGACSVMLDGRLVNSCLVPAAQAQGSRIETIEGVDHPVQQAFLECGGAQCGICTPGMILASINLLKKHPRPTDDQIRTGLAGNLCRCTGYTKIFDSVRKAATSTKSRSSKHERPSR